MVSEENKFGDFEASEQGLTIRTGEDILFLGALTGLDDLEKAIKRVRELRC